MLRGREMVNKNIDKILKDHEKRIKALESAISKHKKLNITKSRKSLPTYILELRDNGFFSQPKTAEETHKKLQGKYHCELNRVEVALIRIANKKQLRKASKIISGKKYKAYVW